MESLDWPNGHAVLTVMPLDVIGDSFGKLVETLVINILISKHCGHSIPQLPDCGFGVVRS